MAAILICLATGFSATAQQIRIMQWNVHGNIGTATAQSSAGAAAIARVLNYLQPDVILINEVADGTVATNTASLLQWVPANLPYMASPFYVAVSTASTDVQRNAVISRFPVLNPITYPDVTTNLRGMHSFQLQLAGTNRLQVFHVHMKCCSDGSSCQEKQDEAQLFSDDMTAWAATNSGPYIFAGDLNEDESNPECPLSAMYHPITTLITNGGLAEFEPTTLDGEYRTWSTAGSPSIRFDYILAATNRLAPISGHVFSTADWALNGLYTNASPQNLSSDSATASDHYCVYADYYFSTNPPLSFSSIQTVFMILMENHNWSSIIGSASAPYINNTVLPMASHAEQYYNPPGIHPSLPNYLWLEAGTNYGILNDSDPSVNHQNTTNHLVTLLKNAGISWRAYQEDICGCNCPLVNTNLYAVRHEPMAFFDDVSNTNSFNSVYCIANIRPYPQLAGDLQSNTVARYNFLTPNLCDDMHNSTGCATTDSVRNGDTWLSNNLPAILNSQAFSNNGAVFIAWDEAGSGDGPIGMIVLSPLARGGGYANSLHYTHSSTLRTMQEIFNVGPMLGDAAKAVDLSDLFAFGAGQLSVSPASGFSASGPMGGPFSPTGQTYTLSNPGSATISWAASDSSAWLTLSPVSGSLAPGSITNVSAFFNANANTLGPGIYSSTITFTNTTNISGSTNFPVGLTVVSTNAQLAVSPATGFSAAGPPGGPFAPGSVSYTLSNIGGASMGWTAASTANWLTLSASSGTLPPGSNFILTASVNANANSLSAGGYSDTVTFANTNNGAGNTTRAVNLSVSTFGFYDNFSNFTNGNLVSQQNWLQQSNISSAPLQLMNGVVSIPGGQTVDNQDASKNFTVTNATVYYGMTLTVSSAVNSSSPSYFAALWTSNGPAGGVGFANYRLSAKAGASNFALAGRVTGQSGDPYTIGPTNLAYGTQYVVIVQATGGGGSMLVYLNPSGANQAVQTYYLSNNIGTGTAPLTVGSFVISQFGSSSLATDGVQIGKVVVSDNFATAYNDLLGSSSLTPFQSWQISYFGSTNNPAAAPNADPDGDGANNLSEFLAGTNPTNAASVFKILSIAQEGDGFRVTWMTGVGKTNSLQVATGAAGGAFSTNFGDLFFVTNTTGTATNFLDAGAATNSASRYYRVRLVQ